MKTLQKVEIDGLLFVQSHIDTPPKKNFLRDMANDLKTFGQWVQQSGHNRAFVGIQKDNPKMHQFVQKRGFKWACDYGHLKLYQRHV